MQVPRPSRAKEIKDTYGSLFRIPAVPTRKTPKGENLKGIPHVDVWWDRDPKKVADETMVIRQDNGTKADVIIVDLGQGMDLLDAISKALLSR